MEQGKELQKQEMKLLPTNWRQSMSEMQITANNNQAEVLALKAPECSTICTGTGSKENGYDLYAAIILMILNFFGVSWKADQIKECAVMLYDDYYFLTLAELKHFAQQVKAGKFTSTHFNPNFFNPVTFIDWMGVYAENSLKIREERALIAA